MCCFNQGKTGILGTGCWELAVLWMPVASSVFSLGNKFSFWIYRKPWFCAIWRDEEYFWGLARKVIFFSLPSTQRLVRCRFLPYSMVRGASRVTDCICLPSSRGFPCWWAKHYPPNGLSGKGDSKVLNLESEAAWKPSTVFLCHYTPMDTCTVVLFVCLTILSRPKWYKNKLLYSWKWWKNCKWAQISDSKLIFSFIPRRD